MNIFKKIFLIFSLFFFTPGILSAQNKIAQKINNLLEDNFFNTTNISIVVYDIKSDKILFEKNPDLLLHPASNMKILTSAAGLLFLGPDYTFKTSLYHTGEIINNTLYGDLYISGGCDPDFSSGDLDSLIKILSLRDVEEISGNIYCDISMKDSVIWGTGWMWDDDLSTDAPYLSALNINDNSIGVFVKGTSPGMNAEIFLKPETGFVEIKNNVLTLPSYEKSKIKVKRDWLSQSNKLVIEGTVTESRSSKENYKYYSLFKPEEYFSVLFQEELLKNNIKFNYPVEFSETPSEAEHLFTFERRFDTVVVNLNKMSDNLSSEMTVYALAEKYYGKPASAENGLKLIDSLVTLAGFNPSEYSFADGSGVSRYNLVSANLITGILKYIYIFKPELFNILYNSFPIAGIDGTLEDRMTASEAFNNVHAKTGTLNGVSSLSGYVTAANGNMIIFSVIIQNFIEDAEIAKRFEDEICKILAGYK